LIYNDYTHHQKEEPMFATATLVAHRGATLVSRDDLARYEPPEPEGRWKPVKHSLIVDLMHEELARRDITVAKEEYAIQREGNYLFAGSCTCTLRINPPAWKPSKIAPGGIVNLTALPCTAGGRHVLA
jgi:hypothetical protein